MARAVFVIPALRVLKREISSKTKSYTTEDEDGRGLPVDFD